MRSIAWCSRLLPLLCLLALQWRQSAGKSHTTRAPSAKKEKETFFRSFLNAAGFAPSGSKSRGPPHATTPGFSDQSAYVGLGGTGAAIAAGDFNRDRAADLLMLNTATYASVDVQVWNQDKFRFEKMGSGASINGTGLSKIESANVADFNNDGILDILLSGSQQGVVFFGDSFGNFNLSTPLSIPELPESVAVVDADSDLAPELFVAFSNGTRGFWSFNTTVPSNISIAFHLWESASKCAIVAGASIATVDLDGDCQAEFVIPTACGLEVWNAPSADLPLWRMKTPHHMRLLGLRVFNSAEGDGVVAYADFDGDGTLDIAVVNLYRGDLVVHLNVQKTRREGMLCDGDSNWRLVRQLGAAAGTFHIIAQRVGLLFHGFEVPASIATGDFDSDGHADVVAIDGRTGKPMLWRNSGRWRHDGSQTDATRLIRVKAPALDSYNAIAAAFWDTGAGGRQDVIVVRRNNNTQLGWNSAARDSDALFFRGTALSALPYRTVPPPFAPAPGATFKVSYSSRLTSRRAVRSCTQCTQAGHWRLRPCRCVLALAHIANYIEEMALGAGGFSRTWSNLMPNSMAIVWAEAGDGSMRWKMDYFTQRRGGPMFSVVAVLGVALAALGGAILYLQRKEKLQDIQDTALERARLFHFGGL